MADSTLSIADLKEDFRKAMADEGIICDDEIIDDGLVHRFDVRGDRKGRRNGWYIFHSDGHVNASYGCHKRHPDAVLGWSPEGGRVELSPEQRIQREKYLAERRAEREEEEKKRHAKAQLKAQKIWDNSVPCAEHEYLTHKGVMGGPARVGPWEIWDRDAHQYIRITENALIIPLMDNTQTIHSLQAIIPEGDLPEGDVNAKKLLAGGAKRGLFCPIGRPQLIDRKTVYVLCEGYATGLSIHQATNHMCLVCFDSGNLPVIAKTLADTLRERGQDATIIIAADNDEWTKGNPGLKKANEAAEVSGGLVACPKFVSQVGKPTDFNDLHAREGLDAVAAIFNRTLNPQANPEPQTDYTRTDPGVMPDSFVILGYTGDSFVFYQHEQKQVKFIGQTSFSEATLLNLAPLEWWEYNFPAKNGYDKTNAVDWINRSANRVGFFDAKRIRGRGAWMDDGRVVYHHGDRLTVDGVQVDLSHVESGYIYPRRPSMPSFHSEPLTASEGRWLLSISRKLAWVRPASAAIAVGWAFLAPLCGMLRWRPHIWVSGGASSGKTTVMRDFLVPMVQGFCELVQGASTEAGIRQELGSDALPVLMDEAEANTQKEAARMETILALIRQSSSESQARTLRGTAGGQSLQYLIRSMFGMLSINTFRQKQADADRLAVLELMDENRRIATGNNGRWKEIEEDFHQVRAMDDLSARMVTRGVSMAPMLMKAISTFQRVGAAFFSSQRKGDQYGTLMAGTWCLTNDVLPTDEDCEQMYSSYQWDEHVDGDESNDAMGALEVVMTSVIKTKYGDNQIQQLVKGLFSESPLIERSVCFESLMASGIRIDKTEQYLCIATGHPVIVKLVANHAFAHDLRGQLKRIPGADVFDNKNVRFGMLSKKVVRIPLAIFMDE
ncbi:toprim domain-containing protein [Salmonella enterica]|nr:toprim domain-containing protein [Salmonella enterica]EAO0118568.1 toprim domain-containing protein [Salmonella enterica]EAO3601672.1 toprim domain-containing protein [Salmonella enterica]EAR6391566.1 toprim domain-containing protein [Salmonella enterica]EAV1285330.1 toprim domain-containing protein [Salmonella enterica]